MNKEKQKIMKRINTYRDNLDEFKNVGLNKPPRGPSDLDQVDASSEKVIEQPPDIA